MTRILLIFHLTLQSFFSFTLDHFNSETIYAEPSTLICSSHHHTSHTVIPSWPYAPLQFACYPTYKKDTPHKDTTSSCWNNHWSVDINSNLQIAIAAVVLLIMIQLLNWFWNCNITNQIKLYLYSTFKHKTWHKVLYIQMQNERIYRTCIRF